MTLTDQEQYMIKVWRELKPYESITCIKDKDGVATRFRVTRSQEIVVTENNVRQLVANGV